MYTQIFLLILTILIGGVLGGYGGYLMGPPDPADLPIEKRKWYFRRSMILGIVAAFIVPIFLRLVGFASSGGNLIDRMSLEAKSIENWLVFFGFCLVAAISSQRFISKVTDTLLSQALEESKTAQMSTKKLAGKIKELEEDVQVGFSASIAPLTDGAKSALFTIYNHTKKRPNINEISKDSDLNQDALKEAINELEERKLVDPKEENGEKTWRVRTAGKAIIGISQFAKE